MVTKRWWGALVLVGTLVACGPGQIAGPDPSTDDSLLNNGTLNNGSPNNGAPIDDVLLNPDLGASDSDNGGADLGTPEDTADPDDPAIDTGQPPPDVAEDAPIGPPDDPSPCVGLAARVHTTMVDVSPHRPGGAVMLAPTAAGGRIAFEAGGQVVIASVDHLGARVGGLTTVAAESLHGFVAQDDGRNAVLVRRADTMVLVGLGADRTAAFERVIVGGQGSDAVGDKWIDSWPHEGRLALGGGAYAVYFGHTQLWDSGRHQGDFLGFFSADGAPQGGGWGWGCSHSLDVRLVHNGTGWGPVCLSDCYPDKAICYNHRTILRPEPSGNCAGDSAAELGGLASDGAGGFVLTFASPEARASSDVGWIHLGSSGQKLAETWLTDAAGAERNPRLAAYGDLGFLAAWTAAGTTLAVVRADGTIADGPVTASAPLPPMDFVTHRNGDVGWAWAAGAQLGLARVGTCH